MYNLHPKFKGVAYRLSNNWLPFIKPDHTKPIRYVEIGTFYGANIISVAESYGAHPDSTLIAIDPWTDYADYPEYKGQQITIYDAFTRNMEECGVRERITVKRGYSHELLPTLEDNSFDIIYIDGNHEPEYVLEDAVLAFRKLKVGGHLIFDDYGWGGPDLTKRGIDGFLNGYHKRINLLGHRDSQVFVQKKH
jgi:predicted O-methyltransferase YrrM